MSEKERLFLTIDDALSTVCHAFAQYPSQFNLFSVIWPMVFGDGAYILKNGGNRSVWVKVPGATRLILSNEGDLKHRIVGQLKRSPPDPAGLARICSRVFGAPVFPGSGPEPDRFAGIWVETDMAGFVCSRCGHCCRTLNYQDGCRVADYRRWQEMGRNDILQWVGTVRQSGRVVACRIWMQPGTNQYSRTCPWLERTADQNRYQCAIYDVRPTICRQYPGTRKHARMTGCRGV